MSQETQCAQPEALRLADCMHEMEKHHLQVAHDADMRPEDTLQWELSIQCSQASAELRRLAALEASIPAPEGTDEQPTWAGAGAFIQHVQVAAGLAGSTGHWPDEFLAWYKPGDWLGEHRAAAVFLGGKLAAQPAPAEGDGRETFEAVLRGRGYAGLDFTRNGPSYLNHDTHLAWVAWQAGVAQLNVQPKGTGPDYAELEREHFGDPDKGTGIYHPDNRPAQAPAPVDEPAVPCTWKKPGESDDAWLDRITGATPAPAVGAEEQGSRHG